MKKNTLYFIVFQLLDIATTLAALQIGMRERNPLIALGLKNLILLKICGITGIAVILEIKKPHKLDKLVTAAAALPVFWNTLMLCLAF